MSQIFSAASIYGIIDRMDAADIQKWINWHKGLKYPPRFLNVFTAARFNEAPNVLRLVRDSLPMTRPVWRGYDGKDAWGATPKPELPWDDSNYYVRLWNDSAKSAAMAAGMWFNQRVKPYLNVIRETEAIIMLLNEATPVFNAPFETEAIRLLGEEGIRAAGFRWATGTPDWPDYQTTAIMDAVSMAAKYNAVVGPHEYSGIKPEEQNSLINRYTKLTDIFSNLKLKTPDVFIGEFGLAKATLINGRIMLNPSLGWREMNIFEQDYAEFIKGIAKTWYIPNKVSFSIYSWPDWGINGSFGVSKSQRLLDVLSLASEWMCFSAEDEGVILPPIDKVLNPPVGASGAVTAIVKRIPTPAKRMLRENPYYLAGVQGQIGAGDQVRVYSLPIKDGSINATTNGKWQFGEILNGNEEVKSSGWFWRDGIEWEPLPPIEVIPPKEEPKPDPVSEPAPATPPAPIPPPLNPRKRYSIEIETSEEKHAIIEQMMMQIISGVVYLGQAMGGAGVTLVTEAVAKT